MSFFDDLFGKDNKAVPKEMADKLIAAGDDLDAMATIVLDELAENKGKKDRIRARLHEAGEDYLAKKAEFERRRERGSVTEIEELSTLDELDDAKRRQEQEAELMEIFRRNELVYRDLLHAIERIRAQGAHRLTADDLDAFKERVQKVNEDHRIKEIAGREFHSINEDIRRHGEIARAESIEERRARHLSPAKEKGKSARERREFE